MSGKLRRTLFRTWQRREEKGEGVHISWAEDSGKNVFFRTFAVKAQKSSIPVRLLQAGRCKNILHMYSTFLQALSREFPHPFMPCQAEAAARLAHFVNDADGPKVFILRGYAGTGKTTLTGALVRVLEEMQRPVVLMAPTGRAAKVLSVRSGREAQTMHRVIYRQETYKGEDTRFGMGWNRLRNALFVVDEASMIARGTAFSDSLFGSGQLLDDLMQYVHSGAGCRLLLVGDLAQLPPVGEENSPALQREVMSRYGNGVGEADLTEVVRQRTDSSVLANATRLRECLTEGDRPLPRIRVSRQGEVRVLPGSELIETLIGAYGSCGASQVMVITRSNRRANVFNQGIRSRVFDYEDELVRGDRVMVVKNNYFWTEQRQSQQQKDDEPLPFQFIANGDCAEVVRIRNVHPQHGFRFADVTLRFSDYGDFEMECRVLLDTLQSESPSLTPEESHRLYESVLADYADVRPLRQRMKCLREDPYLNALQLKFSYAVTCHKAQGGQWSCVFIDQGYVGEDVSRTSYLRWLYTAFTRTTDRVYLVNWPPQQWEEEED